VETKPSRCVALVAVGTYLSLLCGGCLSNEYVISKSELARLAYLPPSQRGAHVHVVQELGSRDEWPVDNRDAVPAQAYADEFVLYDQPADLAAAENLDVLSLLDTGPTGTAHGRPRSRPSSWPRGLPGARGGNPNFVNGWDIIEASSPKGGGSLDDLAVVAIVAVAVAVLAAAGLAVTEGIRYDGFVQLHPEQPVYLKERGGARPVPLAALGPEDVVASQEAVVRDDEDWGLRFAHRRPLDRRGFAFKVDLGSLESLCACYSAVGFASNIQFGYFPHHRVGLLASLTLGGGTSALEHTFQRHSANFETQVFPLNWWRLDLGGFGHGGMQVANDEFGERDGPAFGGGVLLEIALTTRLALTGRWDYTTARTSPEIHGWAGTSTFTAGLAIY
jgi:hypothetical protein